MAEPVKKDLVLAAYSSTDWATIFHSSYHHYFNCYIRIRYFEQYLTLKQKKNCVPNHIFFNDLQPTLT